MSLKSRPVTENGVDPGFNVFLQPELVSMSLKSRPVTENGVDIGVNAFLQPKLVSMPFSMTGRLFKLMLTSSGCKNTLNPGSKPFSVTGRVFKLMLTS